MRRPDRRRADLVLVVVALTALTALAAPASAVQPTDDPLDAGRQPTASQLAASVHRINLPASVHPIDLDTSTVGLERPSQDPAVITLDADILFEFGSAQLTAPARSAVLDIGARIASTTGSVQVVGHTDSIGTGADNLVLSQQRAEAVAAVLRERIGGAGPTIVPSGQGESQPVAANERGGADDPAGRALNRRVEIRTG